jgi:hypothetical protein
MLPELEQRPSCLRKYPLLCDHSPLDQELKEHVIWRSTCVIPVLWAQRRSMKRRMMGRVSERRATPENPACRKAEASPTQAEEWAAILSGRRVRFPPPTGRKRLEPAPPQDVKRSMVHGPGDNRKRDHSVRARAVPALSDASGWRTIGYGPQVNQPPGLPGIWAAEA